MSYDPTERVRRNMIESGQVERDCAAATERWDTEALQRDFTVCGFLAPYVHVIRKADCVKGTLEFTHNPRWYFNFEEE